MATLEEAKRAIEEVIASHYANRYRLVLSPDLGDNCYHAFAQDTLDNNRMFLFENNRNSFWGEIYAEPDWAVAPFQIPSDGFLEDEIESAMKFIGVE